MTNDPPPTPHEPKGVAVADLPLRLTTMPTDDRPADGNRPAVEPLLATARDLAAMLRLSLRTIRAMDRAGKLPKPLRIGRSIRWRYDELCDWIAAGAPCRQMWEARRAARS